MSSKATKRSHKADDERNATRDKKPEPKRPEATPAAVHLAAPAAPAESATQLASYRRQLEELSQHLKVMEGLLSERKRKENALRQQVDQAKAEAARLASELAALRERYRCIGRGARIAANGFDAAKRVLPAKLSSLRNAVQRWR
jgi:uncharacterized coiled-coil DUF342 family protein